MDSNPYQSPKPTDDTSRGPVKVKVYGLFPLTRNAYLALQVILAVVMIAIMVMLRPEIAKSGSTFQFIDEYFFLIIGGILALELIETVVMLSKYKKAEQEQKNSDS